MKKRTLTTNLIFAFLVFLTNGSVVGIAGAAGPSFDCSKAAGSTEQMICKDDVLSTMDHKMTEVYTAAWLQNLHSQRFNRILKSGEQYYE